MREELLARPCRETLWAALEAFAGVPFWTARGLEYTYRIKGREIFVSRKAKSITQATVDMAFCRAMETDRMINGPKKLGVFGASYLYPVFLRLGLIRRAEEKNPGGEEDAAVARGIAVKIGG